MAVESFLISDTKSPSVISFDIYVNKTKQEFGPGSIQCYQNISWQLKLIS